VTVRKGTAYWHNYWRRGIK